MNFRDARAFVLRFGKYTGQTLGQIGDSDEGLRYLDWLGDQPWLKPDAKEAIKAYLGSPAVERELERATGD